MLYDTLDDRPIILPLWIWESISRALVKQAGLSPVGPLSDDERKAIERFQEAYDTKEGRKLIRDSVFARGNLTEAEFQHLLSLTPEEQVEETRRLLVATLWRRRLTDGA